MSTIPVLIYASAMPVTIDVIFEEPIPITREIGPYVPDEPASQDFWN